MTACAARYAIASASCWCGARGRRVVRPTGPEWRSWRVGLHERPHGEAGARSRRARIRRVRRRRVASGRGPGPAKSVGRPRRERPRHRGSRSRPRWLRTRRRYRRCGRSGAVGLPPPCSTNRPRSGAPFPRRGRDSRTGPGSTPSRNVRASCPRRRSRPASRTRPVWRGAPKNCAWASTVESANANAIRTGAGRTAGGARRHERGPHASC